MPKRYVNYSNPTAANALRDVDRSGRTSSAANHKLNGLGPYTGCKCPGCVLALSGKSYPFRAKTLRSNHERSRVPA